MHVLMENGGVAMSSGLTLTEDLTWIYQTERNPHVIRGNSLKEPEIIDHFLGADLKEEMLRIKPVQKQTQAGQRTRFQATLTFEG